MKDMDDLAEIGRANHTGYEKQQEENRAKRDMIPKGECQIFDKFSFDYMKFNMKKFNIKYG